MARERLEHEETPEHRRLRDALRAAIPPENQFIIALDGTDGAGKSTLARYLSWQLHVPAVGLDVMSDSIDGRLRVRRDDLQRLLTSILSGYAAVVVEGVFVLRVLADVGLSPSFTVLVEREGGTWSDCLADEGKRYEAEYQPARICQFRFKRAGDDQASPE